MVGRRGHKITSRAEEEISFPARRCLRGHPDRILVLLDDLEHDRRDQVDYLYELYRGALDHLLDESEKSRAAVHFLVNMLEAYFFADPGALKRALGLDLEAHDGDVEGIRNPKSLLKKHFPGYSERDHGGKVLRELDLHQVLADPETCAWLRSCVSWTVHALGAGLDAPLHSSLDATTAACHLNDGHCQRLTLEQMLPSS